MYELAQRSERIRGGKEEIDDFKILLRQSPSLNVSGEINGLPRVRVSPGVVRGLMERRGHQDLVGL